MADNPEHFEFIEATQGNLDALLPDFVAGDHLWYPVEGHPEICRAPDVYVALGRPKGRRGSYRQWEEGGTPPAVVFEWWSPNSNLPKELATHAFYERYGASEFYAWDQMRHMFAAFVRVGGQMAPVDVSEGCTSPLLGIRFDVEGERLVIRHPDGSPFRAFRELAAERDAAAAERDAAAAERDAAAAERDTAAARAEALAAKLRALGVDPDGV